MKFDRNDIYVKFEWWKEKRKKGKGRKRGPKKEKKLMKFMKLNRL